jgi:uncharacterized protein
MNNELLIIFVQNPIPGKVKKSIAKSIGEENALAVHKELLRQAEATASQLENIDVAVFYDDYIEDNDLFDINRYQKFAQSGIDLGQRMYDAFKQSFSNRYFRVVLIGSDCYELTATTISEAFDLLKKNDVVLGPAKNGAYYLIGMRRLIPALFKDKSWDSKDVFLDTLLDIKEQGYSYQLLPTLTLIDAVEDMGEEWDKLLI